MSGLNEATPGGTTEVSRLLAEWRRGDDDAFERLVPIVYDDLKRRASRALAGERPGHTLQTTALVHEAFLVLVGQRDAHFENRQHFLSVASLVMRRLVIEHARRKNAAKRGAGARVVSVQDFHQVEDSPVAEVLAVDEALTRLFVLNARQAKVVELRYFVGLSIEETAEALGVSSATAKRDWATARAWLLRELRSDRLSA